MQARPAAGFRHIEVEPIASALGASVHGPDLSGPLSDDVVDEIRQALLDNLVIFFHRQTLTPEQLIAFTGRFGETYVDQFVKPMDGYPELLPVIKEKTEKEGFGSGWHYDLSFLEEPSLGSTLYAVEVPPCGGDTLFANMYLGYESLSEGMRAMLDRLQAVHMAKTAYGREARAVRFSKDRTIKLLDTDPALAEVEVRHPVVRTHPETGRKALFVNGTYTTRFEGMTAEESRPLLDFLCRHATQDTFACRFRWKAGDLAFWDNRCVQHKALNDYTGYRREMWRGTVRGDRPR